MGKQKENMKTLDIQLTPPKKSMKKVPVQIFLEPEYADKLGKLGPKDIALGKKVKAIVKHVLSSEIQLNIK